MRHIFAIDPGNTESAYVIYDQEDHSILDKGKLGNEALHEVLGMVPYDVHYAIEMIASYGMPVGKDVFETCLWIGRFIERINTADCIEPDLVYRKDVKMHLCGSHRAKDGNIRQAIIDQFPATGGGKLPQVGTKSQPGPLYGVSKDIWAALGVALTYAEQIKHHEARVA